MKKKINILSLLLVVVLMLSACNSNTSITSVETGSSETIKLKIGYCKVLSLAPLAKVTEKLASEGIEVELVEFQRFADIRTALLSGQIDYGAMGPQDIALALSSGGSNINVLSAFGSGNESIVIRNGVEVEKMSDLEGKTIGLGTGSIAWIKFVASLEEADVSYSDLSTVSVAGGGSNYVAGLQNGTIDVAVLWEPFGAQSVAEGAGYYPSFDINSSEQIGGMTAVLAGTNDAIENKDATQALITALTEVIDEFKEDKEIWYETAGEFTGLNMDIVETAMQGSGMDTNYVLSYESIASMADFMYKQGIIQTDITGDLEEHFDYSFLENATGLSASELGQNK